MRTALIMALVLFPLPTLAQQVLPLTEWRAQMDYELARIPMTREAHGQVIGILQAAERAALQEKMAKAKEQAKEPPKEGQ